MKKSTNLFIFLLIAFFSTSSMVFGIQAETENKCFACHKKITPGLFIQWADSKHAEKNDPDAFLHIKVYVATMVTPKDCGNCHDTESEEVSNSYHATAGEILDSNDAYLAYVAGGSPAVITGCESCHDGAGLHMVAWDLRGCPTFLFQIYPRSPGV